jgi:nitroimidazol reductase NimA-like FMN-containing flavoprotein (pyridoxamine 5'-phosphate oxidase superfamily)
MTTPQVTRPHFPKGYVDHPKSLLPWEEVEARLMDAVHYWLCSVRPSNRPHAVPLWAVWVNGRIYYDGSPETQHGKNIALNPFVTVHLESGEKVIIIEGTAKEVKPSRELAHSIAKAYAAKYASRGYSPEPTSWDAGGLYEIKPHTVIAWNSFTDDPTKFIFPVDSD